MTQQTLPALPTVTHEDLAKAIGVSVTTIKNYRRRFGAFLPVARAGRPLRFNASALDVCRRIRELFADGLPDKQAISTLASEFPSFIQNRHLSKASTSSPLPRAGQLDNAPPDSILKRLEALERAFETSNRRVGRMEKLLEDLFALNNRANTLYNELLAKLDAMAEVSCQTGYGPAARQDQTGDPKPGGVAEDHAVISYGPRPEPVVMFEPPDGLAPLPVVIFSELGEFLGVTDKKGRPFTLKEFQAFLERRTAGLGQFESKWSKDQDAWVLTFGGSGQSSGQIHDHYFQRVQTAKGNLVAHFYQLRINGNIVSKAFLHAFLRQIKDSLE